jgi:RNA polymerase sigma-70 factor (ECF subfamily)
LSKEQEHILIHIKNAQAGDQHAFRSLLDLHWNKLYGFLLHRVENENDAEDICLQAFSKAFDKIDSFDSDFQFNTWITTIAKNLHVDLLRKQRVETKITSQTEQQAAESVADDTLGPEDMLIRSQNLSKLLNQVKQLKPHYRSVIQLRYFQECSHKEIATQLGLSISNVKVRLLRAKKLLAEIINTSS